MKLKQSSEIFGACHINKNYLPNFFVDVFENMYISIHAVYETIENLNTFINAFKHYPFFFVDVFKICTFQSALYYRSIFNFYILKLRFRNHKTKGIYLKVKE